MARAKDEQFPIEVFFMAMVFLVMNTVKAFNFFGKGRWFTCKCYSAAIDRKL
jgi:hypothetical protein|tara:strand:+ start:30 stop:185 length:156 start_codon:yes stop_codon:yes gene_type:complete